MDGVGTTGRICALFRAYPHHLTERESVSVQESMICPHMIDPISVLSNLPRPTDPTLPKLRIGFNGDPRTTARGLEDLMVS